MWCGQQNAPTVSEGSVSCQLNIRSVSHEMSCASCLMQLGRSQFACLCRCLRHARGKVQIVKAGQDDVLGVLKQATATHSTLLTVTESSV